jgi:hypothetical protein
MSYRSNSVKAVKESTLPSLFLVQFAAQGANVGITQKKSGYKKLTALSSPFYVMNGSILIL